MQLVNKKARFNYRLFERFEAGIELKGAEVKSLKKGRGDLANAFAKIIGNEPFLINLNIPTDDKQLPSTRPRKLLLHKREIISLASKIKQKKLTLLPTKLYTKGRLIKVELALAKAKRKFEKKESIKKKDIERDIAQELKSRTI